VNGSYAHRSGREPQGNREIVVLNIIWIVVIGFIAGIIAPGKMSLGRALRSVARKA